MSQIPPVIPLDGTTQSSCSSECYSIEASSQITSSSQQSQNGLSSISCNNSANVSELLVCFPSNDVSNVRMNSELNELTDEVNLSSLSYLESKQRRIDHRRNKSEPVILANLEDLNSMNSTKLILESSSTSTTSNESALSHKSSLNKKKSSKIKTNSPLINLKEIEHKSSISSSTKKKKSWYNNKIKIKNQNLPLESSSIINNSQLNHFNEIKERRYSLNLTENIYQSSTIRRTKSFKYSKEINQSKPFQSTYRQRHEEFRKVFKDLPNDERLIVDYSCAWQKEILIQGRMYISQNYLCFHANFLKWETSLCLKFRDLITITREKTAKVIPNAIEIKTNKNEKYFFASFATRDKSYAMIFRIWQTILIDQPISSQQLWQIIHETYGNNLDMTTDEDDNYQKESMNSPSPSSSQQTKDTANSITPNSIHSKFSEKEELDDHSSISSHCEHRTDDDDDIIPIGEEANTNTLIRQINKQISMTTSDERKYLSKCQCQSHLSTQLIDRTYSMSVQRLFDYIFGGDKDFLVAYHASRRIKDFHANQWKINEETGKRERICSYKVDVAAVFGSTTICSNEKQIIDSEFSDCHYIVDTEVRNEGIKYADTFFVASRYCLVQIGPNKSHLKLTCEVRYVKSVMMIIKSFIEKNAMAALQDSFTDLNNRIELATSTVKRLENECSNGERSSSNNNEKDEIIIKKKPSRKQQSSIQLNDSLINRNKKALNHSSNQSQWSTIKILILFCLITMFILLLLNIFLCIKLNEIDRMTDRLTQNCPLWLNGYEYPKEEKQWTTLLKRQEEYYKSKLNGFHHILISTHNALKNVTDTLNQLSRVTSGPTPLDHIHSL